MFARVSRVQGTPEKVEQQAKEPPPPELQQLPGFKGLYMLLDKKGGKLLAITLWETEEAMQRSAEKANQLRKELADSAGAMQPPVVEMYEVMQQP